jgi:hypothetical protein
VQPWIQSEIDSRKEFFKEIQDLQTTFGLTKAQSREVSTPQTHRELNSSATPKTAFPLYVQVEPIFAILEMNGTKLQFV